MDPQNTLRLSEVTESGELLTAEEFIQMYADPKAYVGRQVEFYAQIFTPVERDHEATYIQAYADPVNYDLNTIIIIEILTPMYSKMITFLYQALFLMNLGARMPLAQN